MLFAKLHPLLVHFPVGLFVSGTLFELYGRMQKEEVARVAGHFNIRMGFWFSLVVASVGFLGLLSLDVKESFRSFVSFHVTFAFVTVSLFTLAMITHRYVDKKPWATPVYLACILMGSASTIATGYFGGELVHRFGVSTLHPLY